MGSEWQNTRCIILFVSSKLYEENIMKKYLLGLGAMLIGAGLMFVFTHTEVSAEHNKYSPGFYPDLKKSSHCDIIKVHGMNFSVAEYKDLDIGRVLFCGINSQVMCVGFSGSTSAMDGFSCVRY